MSYLDLPVPNKSEHLWRYTPWKKVHPTKIDAIPQIEPASVKVNGKLITPNQVSTQYQTQEISRTFLTEANNQQFTLVVNEDNPDLTVDISTVGTISSTNLYIHGKTSGSVTLRITGEVNWFGLSIQGNLENNVNLSYAIINQLNDNATVLRTEDWDVARDSTLEYGELSTGGSRVKSDIRTYLRGKNSSLVQNIAVYCEANRVDDHHIEIHHQSGFSNSSLCVKSACSDKGHAIGTGLLAIDEDCDRSDAGQVFKNLLLSEHAKAESIPELEVLSDDVSAAHGAASSSVDKEQIHYMMARGFDPEDAKAEIVEGFLISSFAKMTNDITRDFLLGALSTQSDY